jgi:hypothetical protein
MTIAPYGLIYAIIKKSSCADFHPEIICYASTKQEAFQIIDLLAKEAISHLENNYTTVYRQDTVRSNSKDIELITVSYQSSGYFYTGSVITECKIHYQPVSKFVPSDDNSPELSEDELTQL